MLLDAFLSGAYTAMAAVHSAHAVDSEQVLIAALELAVAVAHLAAYYFKKEA